MKCKVRTCDNDPVVSVLHQTLKGEVPRPNSLFCEKHYEMSKKGHVMELIDGTAIEVWTR